MARKFRVRVEQEVEVTIDEAKFTPGFLEEFRQSFYPFQGVADHAGHLGQLAARGLFGGWWRDEFVEGYGKAGEAGIAARVLGTEISEVEEMEEVGRAGHPE